MRFNMIEDKIKQIEEEIYEDLSPIKKAAQRLNKKLPLDGRTLSDEAWHFFHFETKDYLLKDLCEELFGHIIDTAMGLPHGHDHYACGSATDSVFLHLLRHLQENDRNILELLSSQNNEIFLRYFKSNLKKLILTQYADAARRLGG